MSNDTPEVEQSRKDAILNWSSRRLYFVEKLRDIIKDEELVADVLILIDNTCHGCWEYEIPCSCWNDE